VGYALDKIVLLALRFCMQNVFVFQSLQEFFVSIMALLKYISIIVFSHFGI